MTRPILSSVLACVLLAACGGDEHSDIKQWMKEAAGDLRGKVPPLPQVKPFPIVSYDAQDRMDPFSAARALPSGRAGAGAQPDFDRPKEPLEAYPLESLRMVGVVKKGATLHALIQAGGAIHQVRAGNHLGQSFGVVTAVTEAEVRIKERVQDPSGQTADWVERPATLQLQEGTAAPQKPAEPRKEATK